MNYQKLTNEELNKCKYPNLIAEIIESGYSTCTLGDFMGLGRYIKEGDPVVWDKINGKVEMPASQACALAKYYNVTIEYLFSEKLWVVDGKPVAYWSWLKTNQQQEKELQRMNDFRRIECELHNRPELLEFMKKAITWSDEQIELATKILSNLVIK